MAVSGLALGFASLGNLLVPHGAFVYHLCGALSAAMLCLWFIKLAFDFEEVKAELKKPIPMSIMPTVTLPVILLCVYVKPYIGEAAVIIWWAANIAHLIIIFVFFKRFVFRLKLETVFPSWLICFVAILASSLTCAEMDAVVFGQITFYVGFVSIAGGYPLVIYRLIKLNPLPEPARPTLAIFTAPVNFTLVGYFSAFDQPNPVFVFILLSVAVFFYIAVLIKMPSLAFGKFYPTFAAFTFPFVISAISFKLANAFLENMGYTFFSPAPVISEWAAVGFVCYAAVRYVIYYATPAKG